ncbi:hypothetical protein TPA0906_66380 [Streptomyces olivaceus]|uniref:hypothetical protein n=1 Tax=Streptomyces olivaceus TaxID=47716 RepID=UPI001CCE2D39|nr:hypothetical protein [Streptomyces olivaceus]MBZ6207500.1 hypothetical protein [Streptomyces olivaceus]MBZ6290374.1 hypothetical protein [Streptomyces olivaceus]MBZ6324326.1 hypothetical protein [Streptomyces olivaceus]GHJ04773.1 hypothetical protein TPA0906_66380 [Streptomyces olivaceus]
MDLTALRVRDARRYIADVENADITDPDLPHRTAVLLLTHTTESLRTMADHAERLQSSVDQLSTAKNGLQAEVWRLQAALADSEEAKPKKAAA